MSKVDEAIAEIDAALAAQAAPHEGLRDYALLDISAETKNVVNTAISQYDKRENLLKGAKAALENLVADGYPALDIPPVEKMVYDDLVDQKSTIDAALAKFEVNEATSVAIVPGEPTEKP